MAKYQAAIKAIASYLPEGKLSNDTLEEEFPEWNTKTIYEKTGISERGVTSAEECASDLGVAAVNRLFDNRVCQPQEIDFLLFCTQSPDYFLPTTACLMQDRLNLPVSCGALDFNLGCSGFVYGLSLAKGLIETGTSKNILLVTGETYTKFIHPTDRSVRTIFGDGASATLISSVQTDKSLIGPFVFGTDGKGGKNLIVPAGGLRNPLTPENSIEQEQKDGVFRSEKNLFMNGPKILSFTLKKIPALVCELFEKSGLKMNDVDHFVFHQANKFMLERLRDKLKIPEEKFCINMKNYANTVSSTIPMAIEMALQQKEIQSGDKVMIAGFGVGYSWAGAMIEMV
jgi:3-oxoacyl-[acyl-carrier-protein] synthase-3